MKKFQQRLKEREATAFQNIIEYPPDRGWMASCATQTGPELLVLATPWVTFVQFRVSDRQGICCVSFIPFFNSKRVTSIQITEILMGLPFKCFCLFYCFRSYSVGKKKMLPQKII